MYKIALNPGHGLYTAGKRCLKALDPNETREWVLNSRICNKIEEKLKAYSGYELIRLDDVTGKTDVPLRTRTDKANAFGADIYIAVHHNAVSPELYKLINGILCFAGGGITAYTYTKVGTTTKELQKALYNKLIEKTGLKGNRASPLATANLHECRESKMPCVLLELGFMDSYTDVPIILTDKYADQVAEGCVEFLVEKGKLKKKQETVLYRVRKSADDKDSQVGAFKILQNAITKAQANSRNVYDNTGELVWEYAPPASEETTPEQKEESPADTTPEVSKEPETVPKEPEEKTPETDTGASEEKESDTSLPDESTEEPPMEKTTEPEVTEEKKEETKNNSILATLKKLLKMILEWING